jgi:hypothetical protein
MELEMKENNIPVCKENLDPNQYTVTLLQEGLRSGLISKQSMENIQTQVLSLFKDLVLRYTKYGSTSVTVETAEKLLNSLYFALDAGMAAADNPAENIALLKNTNIKEIYKQGIAVIRVCLRESEKQYHNIRDHKLDIPLEAYNDTIEKALSDFFRHYNIVFAAHDVPAGIDYPLLNDDQKKKGVFYIRQYLEKLALETEFCRFFHREKIIRTLENYGRSNNIDYEESLINACEIVTNNAVFSFLAGDTVPNLTISRLQYEILSEKLQQIKPAELPALIAAALQEIINTYPVRQAKLRGYLLDYQETTLIPRIIEAAGQGDFQRLIISEAAQDLPDSQLSFKEGARLSDERFRLIFSYILSREKIADKLQIIRSSIPSVQDLRDILQGECLFGEEYEALFRTLSAVELALLGRRVFQEERRSGSVRLTPQLTGSAVIDKGKENEKEWEWERRYLDFLQGLSRKKLKLVERYINELEPAAKEN